MSSARPLVSILLPARNAADLLDTAVRSLVQQSFREWELVIVDDGSGDATHAIGAGWAQQDQRIRVTRAAGHGIVDALNQAIAVTRAPLVARMDADDWSHPTRLEQQIDLLHRRPEVGLVSCLVEFGGAPPIAAGYALHVDWLNRVRTHEDILRNRFVESPVAHPSVMFRRGLLERHGAYRSGSFPEDYELWLRWLQAGVRMEKIPAFLLRWSDPPGRLSRTDARYSAEAFFEVKAAYVAEEVGRLFKQQGSAREVWVWGAGRPTRKRARALENAGLPIAGYIDIDPRKTGRLLGKSRIPVVAVQQMPPPRRAFVLGYVSSRGARSLIRGWLKDAGYVEGADFLMCA